MESNKRRRTEDEPDHVLGTVLDYVSRLVSEILGENDLPSHIHAEIRDNLCHKAALKGATAGECNGDACVRHMITVLNDNDMRAHLLNNLEIAQYIGTTNLETNRASAANMEMAKSVAKDVWDAVVVKQKCAAFTLSWYGLDEAIHYNSVWLQARPEQDGPDVVRLNHFDPGDG